MRIILTFKGLNKVIRLSLHYSKGLYKKNRLAIKSPMVIFILTCPSAKKSPKGDF
jgi:hypothetical protein